MNLLRIMRWHIVTYFQSIDIVRKYDDLIASFFVISNEELACLKFVGIHAIEQHPLSGLFSEILPIKFWCHGTPNLSTLDRGSMFVLDMSSGEIRWNVPERSLCVLLRQDPW